MTRPAFLLVAILLLTPLAVGAIEYPYQTAEPQKSGWPLSDEERAYVLRPEHERRPGREANKGPIDGLLVGDSIAMQWGAAIDCTPRNSNLCWRRFSAAPISEDQRRSVFPFPAGKAG